MLGLPVENDGIPRASGGDPQRDPVGEMAAGVFPAQAGVIPDGGYYWER